MNLMLINISEVVILLLRKFYYCMKWDMYPYLDEITVTKVTASDSAALVQKLHF